MKKVRYNIALIGQTGVGKSSLINALLGKNVSPTGVGKPVTKRGFHFYDVDINKIPVTLIDSWGLEANKSAEWKEKLEEELEKRKPSSPPENWFHTIIYCVNSGSDRIQEFEIGILKSLINNKYHVFLVFTKADYSNIKKLEVLKMEIIESGILQKDISFFNTCSVEEERMDGTTSKTFGVSELRTEMCLKFWEAVTGRLPSRCLSLLHEKIDSWIDLKIAAVDSNVGIFGASDFVKKFQSECDKYFQNIGQEIQTIVKNECIAAIKMFGFLSTSFKINNDFHVPYFENIKYPNLDKSFRYALGTFFHILYSAAGIGWLGLEFIIKPKSKKDVKRFLNEVRDRIRERIDQNEPDIKEFIEKVVQEIKSEK